MRWVPKKLGFCALALLLGLAAPPVSADPGAGVVLESLHPTSALVAAGLQVGDVLISWERPAEPPLRTRPAQGELVSPFEWRWLLQEQAPRGIVRLFGRRADRTLEWTVEPGIWDGTVRPVMSEDWLETYEEGRRFIEQGAAAVGLKPWRVLAEVAAAGRERRLAAWFELRRGEIWTDLEIWPEAYAAFALARRHARDPLSRATIRQAECATALEEGDFAHSEEACRQSLEILRASWGESLAVAQGNHRLAEVLWFSKSNPLEEVRALLRAALDVGHRLAPESLPVADAVQAMGILDLNDGDLESAQTHFEEAQELFRRLAPESLRWAGSLDTMRAVAFQRGELDTAEDYGLRSLEIRKRLAPDQHPEALGRFRLAALDFERGHLETSENHLRKALEIWQDEGSSRNENIASTLSLLGRVASERADLDRAEDLYLEALQVWQTISPDGPRSADLHNNLAGVAFLRGQLERAQDFYSRAVELRQAHAPESLRLAHSLYHLGRVSLLRDDLEAARKNLELAEQLYRTQSASGFGLAAVRHQLGRLAHREGDLDQAETLYREALAMRHRLEPQSDVVAATLADLAEVAAERGRGELSAALFLRAMDALEGHIGRLGGSRHVQGIYRARHRDLYHRAIEVEVALGRTEEAFAISERARARTFLDLLADRELIFSSQAPPELELARRRTAALYDQTQRQFQKEVSETDPERLEELARQLRELREEQSRIHEEIRDHAPALSALQSPRPLDFEGARKALDPGTVGLSYSLGEGSSQLFVFDGEGNLEVHTLRMTQGALERQIHLFRRLIENDRQVAGAKDRGTLESMAQNLYDVLLAPAEARLESGQRLLILPDGPLHRLPFGALQQKTETSTRFLAEWKPFHVAPSMTVFDRLRGRRGASEATLELAAFGDPDFDTENLQPSSFSPRNLDFSPLPSSRHEVDGIAALYPTERTATFVGEESTEERAKALAQQARVLHFAVHGHLNDHVPLDSALVLSSPQDEVSENGFWQVWELFEGPQFTADLVVLSACGTALGKDQGGEGIQGLTRAFQFAGARTVIASLWSVDDRSTAELMVRFHRFLRQGLSPDEALRSAQIASFQDAEARDEDSRPASPFHWAAFQVYGDWHP